MFGSQESAPPSFWQQIKMRLQSAVVTKWLIIANLIIFAIGFSSVRSAYISYYGAFVVGDIQYYGVALADSFQSGEIWRLLTFQFLHGNVAHVLLNMLGLFFFGTIVERVMGARKFLAYYLLCGVAGGLFYYFLVSIGLVRGGPIVGASAGLYGVLAALVVIAPNMQVMLLIPPIPMKMKTLAWVLLGMALFSILITGKNAGGEAGHLGGALLGFVLMKNPRLLGWVDRIGSGQSTVRKVSNQPHYQAKVRPRTYVNMESTEVDRILDKVSAEGLHSLSDEERETLQRISNKS